MSSRLKDPFGAGPAPPAAPPAPPAPVVAAASPAGRVNWLVVGLVVVVVLVVGLEVYRLVGSSGPRPGPAPAASGVALGRAFAPVLAASLADGFDALDAKLGAGSTVADADKALKTTFLESRQKAFAASAAPAFAAIVPDGTEPKDAATIAAYRQLARDFAKGLRGAK